MIRVYTFGYLGHDVAELLDLADALDAVVIDVRESAMSRASEWAGWSLRRALGVRYLHVRSFGNVNYKNGGALELRDPEAGLRIVAPVLATQSVVLLCACRDPHSCHRSVVARLLAEHCEKQIENLGDLTRLQGDLF